MQRHKTEQNSGFFQRLFFNWVAPLIHVGLKKPLDEEDIFELNDSESPIQNFENFETDFKSKIGLKNALFKTLWHLHKKTYGGVAVLSSINLICVLLNPLLIREIIKFLQLQNGPLNKGIILAFFLLISVLTASMGIQHLFHVTLKIGMRVRAGLVLAIYRKALALTPEARQNSPTGEIVNLMSNDAAKIVNFAPQLHSIFAMPVQICVAVCMLFWLLGTSMIAGLFAMLILTLFSHAQAKKMIVAQKMLSEVSDSRISAMGEILLGIRVIKFYAWEKFFFKNISKFREKEIQFLYILALKRATVSVLFLSTPIVVGIVTFSTHLFLGKTLNAPDVFSALAFFGVIRPVLSQFPITLSAFIDAGLSAKRLEKFLNHTEIKPRSQSVLESGSVRMENASLSISKESGPILQLQIEIAPGECVAVVGPVAAGKSLLLLAMLGELNLLKGHCEISGSIAYVAQQAWIVNATVRENITFGSEFNPQKYAQCLFVCALEADLAVWPAGDQTEIGEQGVNLSGGQKQRISLARAVYKEADIYLLDDPLSALDSGVSDHIFNHCINGFLKSKTRIYVTHRLEYSAHSNRVLLLENGKIVESGTLSQIHQNRRRLWDLLSSYKKSGTGTSGVSKPGISLLAETVSHPPFSQSGKLVADEERMVGAVKSNIYRVYMRAIAPGFLLTILIGSFFLREVFAAANDGWLAYSTASKKLPVVPFLGVYAALGLCAILSTYIRTFLTFKGGIHASTVLHEKIIRSVLRSPMRFFESTPTGRVLNRFSKDMEVIDQYIPSVILDCFGCIFSIFSALFVVCAATPFALLILLPVGFVYYRIQKMFRKSSREIKRLESISRSPVFAHFSESLSGASSIRAFAAEDRFLRESAARFEVNQRAFYTMISLNRWLGTRLEVLGGTLVFSAVLFAVFSLHKVNPGVAGLSITYALLITGALNWAVRTVSEFESSMNAVERVNHYSNLPEEKWLGQSAPLLWPSKGHIQIQDLFVTYRQNTHSVLKGISVDISPGEKVGLVGRTGSGKSSLLLALCRILEAQSGLIMIDGIDISKLPLHELRNSIAIIPQDPVLFAGTVRSNLDPFLKCSNSQLMDALTRSHLMDAVAQMPLVLDAEVKEGGLNFSVGQRQLLCLARALIKQARILLLDEATASVDFELDAKIQETVRVQFKHSTVIVIAHRLNTIRDVNRVLVLESGKIVKVVQPTELLHEYLDSNHDA